MFGGLFDEEAADVLQTEFSLLHVVHVSSQYKQSSESSRTMSEGPPSPRTETKLCGLDNLGATCYLNTLIQTLLYTPEFRDALFQLKAMHLGSLEDQDRPNSNVRLIPIQLQRLFARLLLADISSTTTTDLVASFGWTEDENFEQQDVQELHHTLMNAIEKSLIYTPGQDMVSRTFYGKLVNQIKCLKCGGISESKEDFLDISVSIVSKGCLESGLNAAFVGSEKMMGKNRFKCNTCCQLVEATKSTKLHSLPPILGFSLLRFVYNAAKCKSIKDKRKFAFPDVLNMAPYCDVILPSKDTQYELFSVLIHSGSAQSGHYHVYIKDIDELGYSPFVEEVMPTEVPLLTANPLALHTPCTPLTPSAIDKTDARLKDVDLNDPVQLVSFILSCQPDARIKIGDMKKIIQEIKGNSWSSSFHHIHGPLERFILKRNEFDTSKDVVRFSGKNSRQRNKKPSGDTSTECESKSVITPLNVSTNHVDVLEAVARPPPERRTRAPSWFDFNDAEVAPIPSSEIKRLYGGEECAYMLFYRRNSLKRPLEAMGNPCYGIPESLLKLIDEENKNLQLEREAYNLAANTITLNVHLGACYHLVNGGLFRVNESEGVLSVRFNKEGTLEDLYKAVRMACCTAAETRFTLTFAKVFAGGLHLYDDILANCAQKLSETGLKDDGHLLLWDGDKIGGSEIDKRGTAHEPLLLNFNYTAKDGKLMKLSHSFPKSSTLGHVVFTIAEKLQTPPEQVLIKHGIHYSNSMDGSTIDEMDISNSHHMTVEILTSGYDVKLAMSNKICLTIKNNFEVEVNPKKTVAEQCNVAKVIIDRAKTIGEVRQLVSKEFGLKGSMQCNLAVVKDDVEYPVPLFEDLTVFQSNLSAEREVLLQNGPPPRKGELTLRILSTNGNKMDFNVSKYISAERFLQKVIRTADLEGSNWCLRPKMWDGDAGKALPNNNSSIYNLGIQHGATLVVEHRKMQVSDVSTIALTIWFYPTSSVSGGLQFERNSPSKICDPAFKKIVEVCPTQPTQLGELCIPTSTKLDELKLHILAIPPLENIKDPSKIRVRMLIDNKPSRVLRGPKKMLKSLKIADKSHLCVQLLPTDENLSTNAVVLSVMRRLANIRGYQPPCEIILDCGASISTVQFKEALAGKLSMLAASIHVAKKDVSRCEWIVIEDNYEFTEKHMRHKPAKKYACLGLTVGGVTLFDGDVLGVKDLDNTSEDRDDFSTDEDDLIRMNQLTNVQIDQSGDFLNGAIDGDGISRHSKIPRTCSSEPSQAKSSSQGITIHVGDFTQSSHLKG